MTREQKIEKAKKLRAKGWSYRRIAEELGTGYSTVRQWLDQKARDYLRKYAKSDKGREMHRRRMRKYARSEKGREARCNSCRKYRKSERGRKKIREYLRSEKGREMHRAASLKYAQSEKGRESNITRCRNRTLRRSRTRLDEAEQELLALIESEDFKP